jgi:AraC-like DNA-binding protein
MQIIGVGQINFWSGGSLWIGQSHGSVDVHAHHALQVSLALRGGIRLRSGSGGWAEFAAAFVPPHLPHAFEAAGSTTATIFCEPESQVGRRLLARFGGSTIAAIERAEADALAGPLRDAYAIGASDGRLNELAVGVLESLAQVPVPAPKAADPRVLRAMAEVAARLDRPLSLREVAGQVHISPSRLRHLFVSETGMTFRPYVLWLRLLRALELAVSGESWTAAAHGAAFADSAHLARTFRRMFGVSPTALGRAQRPDAGREGLLGDVPAGQG